MQGVRLPCLFLFCTATHALLLPPSPRARPLRMADEGLTPENIASFFEDKPPPSWGSPEWKWGYADGAAHDVAARVREELAMKHRRSALLSYADMGAVDFFDLKMVSRSPAGAEPRLRRAGRAVGVADE